MVKASSVLKGKARAQAQTQTSSKRTRGPSPDDSLLDSDSEVDEFAQDYASGSGSGSGSGASDDDDNELEDGGSEEEEVEGNARWEPDDWDEEEDSDQDESESEDGDEQDDNAAELRRLQNDLTSLPLSTLAKAQKALGSRKSTSSASSSSNKEDKLQAIKAKLAQLQKGKGKAVDVPLYEDDRAGRRHGDSDSSDDDGPESQSSLKRGNKHAPASMSTKRQVSRNRQVVDVHKPERRDPRFSSVSAGQVDPHLHSQSYAFLPSLLKEELYKLRKAVSAAAKVERTCPWAEKPARTAEREKLEDQLGKLRTRLVRTEREEMERNVLASAKKEEREKREHGKGAWYMKKGEKRDLLLKARFETLEKKGGKTAVKKAIEKKRKKTASKEKKSRPFAKGESGMGGDAKRRRV
ncbi:hypothetical protein CI109_104752 [Kwoniella shandongensis]|uniref:rRNA biogenesis protein RRP36 n=1 Tax=Kwoniella shandongensis TaxID=1734106 RepID=A0A5M6BP50_9TREE|nr:uncharacterized protein CI109_006991 [Kwoniella shandongensis]KAA5524668.1 hypothetical protein CI109_006991 [Kwoniella shandongensis]